MDPGGQARPVAWCVVPPGGQARPVAWCVVPPGGQARPVAWCVVPGWVMMVTVCCLAPGWVVLCLSPEQAMAAVWLTVECLVSAVLEVDLPVVTVQLPVGCGILEGQVLYYESYICISSVETLSWSVRVSNGIFSFSSSSKATDSIKSSPLNIPI